MDCNIAVTHTLGTMQQMDRFIHQAVELHTRNHTRDGQIQPPSQGSVLQQCWTAHQETHKGWTDSITQTVDYNSAVLHIRNLARGGHINYPDSGTTHQEAHEMDRLNHPGGGLQQCCNTNSSTELAEKMHFN